MKNETTTQARAELISAITDIARALIDRLDPDPRATEDDEAPEVVLTIGTDSCMSAFGWQSGDNSFSGGAYGFPVWGVAYLYQDTDPAEIAGEIVSEIESQVAQLNP